MQFDVQKSQLLILFLADLLAGVIFFLFHKGILDLLFLILLAVNILIFIKVWMSDFEQSYRERHPRAGTMRKMGYFWVFGLFMFFLVGGPAMEPWWATPLGLSWSGFLIWITFREAKKFEARDR
jgi:hypothetical protein